jgi:hypothetical protein
LFVAFAWARYLRFAAWTSHCITFSSTVVISRIVLSFKFSNILNPTESLIGSRILLVQIWISWFVLVDIGILIYAGWAGYIGR